MQDKKTAGQQVCLSDYDWFGIFAFLMPTKLAQMAAEQSKQLLASQSAALGAAIGGQEAIVAAEMSEDGPKKKKMRPSDLLMMG